MVFPQILLIFYNLDNPNYLRGFWANFDELGFFLNITNLYCQEVELKHGNTIYTADGIWVLGDNLDTLIIKS